ncbi:MAG: hypothetical protein V1907_03040 [Candidatus Kerfeldbacteria bacterium]
MDNIPASKPAKKGGFLVPLIIAIVVGAAGFSGGMMFQKSQDSLKNVTGDKLQSKLQSLGLSNGFGGPIGDRNVNGSRFINGNGFPGGRTGGGGMVSGEIISSDSTSVTIKQQDGSTKVVYFTSSTTIDKTVAGTSSDLTVGKNITANGTANSDGSIAAQTIQLRSATALLP